jgi:drug/metabolite transporter (DMT)-like permease
MAQPIDRTRLAGIALAILATACWSTSGLFVSLVLSKSTVSPPGLAFWRDLGTFLLLLVGLVLFRRDLLLVRRSDLFWLAAMGGLGIGLLHITWNMAVVLNGMAVATILQYNAPIYVAAMAWLLWREPLTAHKMLAILLALLGTVLIASAWGGAQARITLPGLLFGLATAVAFGNYTLLGRRLSGDYSPWTVMLYAFGFAALSLLPWQFRPVPIQLLPPTTWAPFLGLVLFTTVVGFAFYAGSLQRLPASVASIVATTEVPFAALVAYVALGQQLSSAQFLGAALVVGGVVLVSLPAARRVRTQIPDTSQAG